MVKGSERMNQRIGKIEIKERVGDKLKEEKIIIGGNGKGHPYSKRYKLKYTKEIIEKVINALMDVFVDIIEDGDTVVMTEYFQIESQFRKERLQINPYTKELYRCPAHYILKTKAMRRLKNACSRMSERVLTETTAANDTE